MVDNVTERKNKRLPNPGHHPELGSPQIFSQEMADNPEYTNIQIVGTVEDNSLPGYSRWSLPLCQKKVRLPFRLIRGQSTG